MRVSVGLGFVVVTLATAMGGCAEPRTSTSEIRVARQDSGGWHIVEFGSLPEAVGGPDLATVIGSEETGRAEYILHNVGTVRFWDDEIVVSNGIEVLRFNRSGELLGVVGRAGEGPGEFGNLWSAWPVGDTLFAMDADYYRLSVFDRSWQFIEQRNPIGTAMQFPPPPQILGGGWFSGFRRVPFTVPWDGEVRDFPTRVVVVGPGGEPQEIDTLRYLRSGRGARGARFWQRAQLTGRDGRTCYSEGATYEVRCVDVEGGRMLLRAAVAGPELDAALARDSIERISLPQTSERGDSRRESGPPVADVRLPERLPAVTALQLDGAGRVWVRRAVALEAHENEVRWDVFGPTGEFVVGLMLPRTFRVEDSHAGYLVGVSHHPVTGVASILLYEYGQDLR